jgi:hypothetical protein
LPNLNAAVIGGSRSPNPTRGPGVDADRPEDTERVVALLRAHFTDPQAVQRQGDDGTVALVLDTERAAPPRELAAQEWTSADGSRRIIVRDKDLGPLTDEEKAGLEDWSREQRRKPA